LHLRFEEIFPVVDFFVGAPPRGCPDKLKYSTFWTGTGGLHPNTIDSCNRYKYNYFRRLAPWSILIKKSNRRRKEMRSVLIVLMIIISSAVVFPKKVALLPELNNPHAIESDGKNFYIADGTTVHIYSMKDFKHTGTFGKRGDGPQEIVPSGENPIQMSVLNDSITLSSFLKMVTFTKTGKPISEKVFHTMYVSLIPFGKNFAAVKLTIDPGNLLIDIYQVLLISPDWNTKKTLLDFKRPPVIAKNQVGITIPLFTHLAVENNLLYVFDHQHDKEFMIFNPEGKLIKTLPVGLQKIKITESIKNEVLDYLIQRKTHKKIGEKTEDFKKLVYFREYFPSVRLFKVKDGIIYIQTYEKKGKEFRFVLMDLNGKILKSLFLPVEALDILQFGSHTTFCFDKNTYYYLQENEEDENWELHSVMFSLDKSK